ncbi:MAG: PKD domain-containing protein [Bacteroidota bacterium]|nr:PKD domain-containing protein [Bacteroidota bacterium]
MKTNLIKTGTILGIGALLITASCKKEVAPGFTPSATEVAIGESVSFTDNEEQRKNSSFMWDFGDGSERSHDRNPSHVYTKAGTYTVSQTVSLDKNAEKGKSLKASSSAVITVTGPTANFTTAKTSYSLDEPILFTNTTTSSDKGSPVSYNWSFVSTTGWDNYLGGTKSIATSFGDAGVYTVTLIVTQGQTQSTKSMDLLIGGATSGASTKAMILGDWKFTSDVTVITGQSSNAGCNPANGTNTNTNIPTTVNFEHDGDLVEMRPTGNQATGQPGSWSLSEDGMIMYYSGASTSGSFKIKTLTATSLVLERVFIEDQSAWSCGMAVTTTRTVTLTK